MTPKRDISTLPKADPDRKPVVEVEEPPPAPAEGHPWRNGNDPTRRPFSVESTIPPVREGDSNHFSPAGERMITPEPEPDIALMTVQDQKEAAEVIAGKTAREYDVNAITDRERRFAKTAVGRILIRKALDDRGLNPDTFAEMVAISAEVGRGQGLTIDADGVPSQISIHSSISQKGREHVTKELGNVYDLNRKDSDDGSKEIRVVFSEAFNRDGTGTRTVGVSIQAVSETE